MRSSRFPLFFAAAAASIVFTTNPVHAGGQYTASESCSSSASGGSCSGTFLGFRNGTGWNDFVTFNSGIVGGATYYSFFASYGNAYYSCSVPSSLSTAVGPILMNARGWFQVQWNSAGQCTSIFVDNDSAYAQTW